MIEAAGDMVVVGEASDGRALLQRAEAEPEGTWDVLILDLSLPRVSGFEALRRLRALRPALRIVVLSMYGEEQYGSQVLKAGASAYLSKDRPGEDVLDAIRAVASGAAFSSTTASASGTHAEKAPHERLTPREYQVFVLLIQGSTVSEIAAELNLTAGTVSGHLMKVKEKLSAASVPEIMRYAHRMGLIS